jgi:cellulose 1,4-beta-cellobiosidase
MMFAKAATLLLGVGLTAAQQIGHGRDEAHLYMPIQKCTGSGCAWETTSAVLDSNWRWTHKVGCTNSSKCNCYLGNVWLNASCPDVNTCTNTCALDGEDEKGYKEKYGVEVDQKGMMNLTFVTKYESEGANGTNVGNRMYLLENETHYKMFKLLNKEFTFTVDMSKMPCGLNGAVYFVEMDADGGVAKNPTNKAGAKYGTGYCDAQCPHDLKWIDGQANMIGWNKSISDKNAGAGKYGTCCAELDIWEANKISTQMTVHSCSTKGAYRCEGVECGDNNGKNASDPGDRFKGVCDKNGCDFNPYREGAKDFYGPGPSFKLDSTKPMTVVTQFITDDGTDTGKLKEMRRFYVQDGKRIYNPAPSYTSSAPGNWTALSDATCATQMNNFSDRLDVFQAKGGIAGMGEAMARSMALVISLWDDHEVGMIWLDATDPYPVNPKSPWGAARGSCNQTSGNYTIVEKEHGDSYGLFYDIKYGEIGSTLAPSPGPVPPSPSACPGGSLTNCIAACPTADPAKYKACITDCMAKCNKAAATVEEDERVFPGEHYGFPVAK